jgi:nucleotide-binding universal stress UspA family protein
VFKKILVPVDGSPTSSNAIEKAAAIAAAFDGAVTVVSVIDNYAFTGVGVDFAYGPAEYLAAATAEANACVSAARQLFESRGIPVTASVVEGHAAYRGVLETAETMGADLIVMGSHGRRGLEKFVLGSVAAQVLSHAHVPILIVRE